MYLQNQLSKKFSADYESRKNISSEHINSVHHKHTLVMLMPIETKIFCPASPGLGRKGKKASYPSPKISSRSTSMWNQCNVWIILHKCKRSDPESLACPSGGNKTCNMQELNFLSKKRSFQKCFRLSFKTLYVFHTQDSRTLFKTLLQTLVFRYAV